MKIPVLVICALLYCAPALAVEDGLVVLTDSRATIMQVPIQGTSISELFDMLRSIRIAPKDKFEARADYEKRRNEVYRNETVGFHKVTDVFVFIDERVPRYSAERKGYEIYIPNAVTVKEEPKNYPAQTMFGSRMEATRQSAATFGLKFANLRQMDDPSSKGLTSLTLLMPYTPEQARADDANLCVVYLVRLAPPYVADDWDPSKMTVGGASHNSTSKRYVVGQLTEVRVVRTTDGKVLFHDEVLWKKDAR